MFTHPELWVSRLIFVGLLIEAAETIRIRFAFAPVGVFSAANLGVLTATTRWHQRIGATVGSSREVAVAAAIQAVAAVVVIIEGMGTTAGVVAALGCLVTAGYLRMRRQIGGSGAEQLTFIALVTFLLVVIAGGDDTARLVGDVFIGAQVLLAYGAAGVAKACSARWRQGGAMAGILSTEGYGLPRIGRYLAAHPGLDRAIGWSVIAWEIGFVAILFAPTTIVLAILATGAVFHIGCAVLMGLNRFVWAFVGCYPAVFVTVAAVHGW
ncbi:hypothetical protein ACWDTI_13210 [Gordonia sp. NPDC003424]